MDFTKFLHIFTTCTDTTRGRQAGGIAGPLLEDGFKTLPFGKIVYVHYHWNKSPTQSENHAEVLPVAPCRTTGTAGKNTAT